MITELSQHHFLTLTLVTWWTELNRDIEPINIRPTLLLRARNLEHMLW
jgi:hypothetical protein